MPIPTLGVSLPMSGEPDTPDKLSLISAARHAERLGFDSVSVSDVFLGDGTPALESIVAATAAAAATNHVTIEFGVLVLPIRRIAWLAAQVASLQHLSHDRVVLGVGTGGFPQSPFWQAVDGPQHGRGAVTDAALETLPNVIAGEPTVLHPESARPPITLAPPATIPPILVGGHSDVAIRRAVTHADGWFPSLMPPRTLARRVDTLRQHAAARGRTTPLVHFGTHAMLGADASTRHAALIRELTNSFGMHQTDAESVPLIGTATQVAEQLTAYATSGADHVTVALDGANPPAQLEILAEARALLRT